jgi:hypothetical protein
MNNLAAIDQKNSNPGGKIMSLELFKKFKIKTLLIAAGFLVLAGIIGLSFWFYFNFLRKDNFLEAVPAESVLYWQSDFNKGVDDVWLWAITKAALSSEAAGQTDFLEKEVVPEVERVGLAVLPDFADFIFLAQMEEKSFDSLRNKLEELNYHYTFGDEGRVIVSNSRFGLGEAIAALAKEKKSLVDDKMKLVSFNRARQNSLSQIYFGENFKVQDFRSMPWFSDFWAHNSLDIALKSGVESPQDMADFNFLVVSDDKFLKNSMEEVIKDDLSILFPQIQERILPDKTRVKELLANPDIFIFQDEEIGGLPIHYLSVGGLNQEFLVGREGQGVLFSNSTEMVQSFLSNIRRRPDYYGKSLGELIQSCLKWLTPNFSGIVFEVDSFAGSKTSL